MSTYKPTRAYSPTTITTRGRVAKDPRAVSEKLTEVTLAVNTVSQQSNGELVEYTDWYSLKFMNSDVEYVIDNVQKGDILTVTGSVTYNTWGDEGDEKVDSCILVRNWGVYRAYGASSSSGSARNNHSEGDDAPRSSRGNSRGNSRGSSRSGGRRSGGSSRRRSGNSRSESTNDVDTSYDDDVNNLIDDVM